MAKNKEKDGNQVWVIVVIVMISAFVTPFNSNAINIAIPSIANELGGSQYWLNLVVSAFLIPCAAFLLPFGRFADQYGRKRIFLIGTCVFSAASLGCSLSPSLLALVLFRALQGIGSAMVFGTSTAILSSAVPPQSRGKMLGLVSSSTYVGLSAGPVLGGFLTNVFTWRGIFYFNVLLTLIILVLALWKMRGEWKGTAAKIDSLGSVLCVAAQILIIFGLGDLTAGYLFRICFAAGVIILVVFILYERKRKDPLVPIETIAKNRLFVFSNLATLINYSATFALSFVYSLYLQIALGIDIATCGLIMLVQPVLMAVLSPLTGSLSDRVRPTILASMGMGIMTVGVFCFIFLTLNTPIFLFILNLAFIGVGFALFASPNTNAVMGSVDTTLYGVASSLMSNMRMLGQSISMAIVSLITSVIIRETLIGSAEYVGKLMTSMRIILIVFAVLCGVGIFTSLARE